MKSTIIKPPNPLQFRQSDIRIFLAGSIEQGKAENWQNAIIENLQNEKRHPDLKTKNVIVFNPRREEWDSTWEQSLQNRQFTDQVNWELAALENSDLIIMYIQPDTKSPISLLEFGMYAKSNKLIVCCPEGFWRKGNVDVVCRKYKVPQARDFDDLEKLAKIKIAEISGKKLAGNLIYILVSLISFIMLVLYIQSLLNR